MTRITKGAEHRPGRSQRIESSGTAKATDENEKPWLLDRRGPMATAQQRTLMRLVLEGRSLPDVLSPPQKDGETPTASHRAGSFSHLGERRNSAPPA